MKIHPERSIHLSTNYNIKGSSSSNCVAKWNLMMYLEQKVIDIWATTDSYFMIIYDKIQITNKILAIIRRFYNFIDKNS